MAISTYLIAIHVPSNARLIDCFSANKHHSQSCYDKKSMPTNGLHNINIYFRFIVRRYCLHSHHPYDSRSQNIKFQIPRRHESHQANHKALRMVRTRTQEGSMGKDASSMLSPFDAEYERSLLSLYKSLQFLTVSW